MEWINYIMYLFYAMILSGLYLTFADDFSNSLQGFQVRAINKKLIGGEGRVKETSKISIYVEDMLATVKGEATQEAVIKFYEFSVLVGMITFIITFFGMSKTIAPLATIIAVFMPFVYYRTKLQTVRNETSREGEILVGELLSNYKIYHRSMRSAIENTVETISDEAPRSKRLLVKLQYELNAAATKQDIKNAINSFKFGIDTNWAKILAMNIEMSVIQGIDISVSMNDLMKQLINARKAAEETKRQGSEAKKMLKYLIPGIYVLTLLSAIWAFDMSMAEVLHNQFKTNTGAACFMGVIITYVGSLVAGEFINKNKMDI